MPLRAPTILGLCALALLAFADASTARAEVAVPPLTARVTDLTRTLTATQQQSLEQTLAAFEARKGSQIAVLIVPSTAPEAIEQYSLRVAEAWKLGRKGMDDGVLLLVAKDDRRLRIEVGHGLEGAIPDAVAKRVVSEVITPRFKQGDFDGGIRAGVEQLIGLVDGEKLPEPSAEHRNWTPVFDEIFPWAFAAIFVLGPLLRAIIGRLSAALVTGGLTAGVIWLISASLLIAAIGGLFLFVITLAHGGSGGRGSGHWSSGGGHSGGSSSGGGGGFSGGGGSFGGGGASGSW